MRWKKDIRHDNDIILVAPCFYRKLGSFKNYLPQKA